MRELCLSFYRRLVDICQAVCQVPSLSREYRACQIEVMHVCGLYSHSQQSYVSTVRKLEVAFNCSYSVRRIRTVGHSITRAPNTVKYKETTWVQRLFINTSCILCR